MMRRFLRLWMSLFLMSIVGDEGGGDFFIDDGEDDAPEPKGADPKAPEPKLEEKDDKEERLSELEAFKREEDIKKAITSAVDVIKSEHKEFDIDKVSSVLKEMHKKDPVKAAAYNTPAGWEAIWLKNFAGRDSEGTFDPGRNNAEEPFDFERTQKMALSGDKRAMQKLFQNSK